MVNAGTHKNNSIFAISLKPLPHLGRMVAWSVSLTSRWTQCRVRTRDKGFRECGCVVEGVLLQGRSS